MLQTIWVPVGLVLVLIALSSLFFIRRRRRERPILCQPMPVEPVNGVGCVRGLEERREKAQGKTQRINYDLLGICLRSKPVGRQELAEFARKKTRRRERQLVKRT